MNEKVTILETTHETYWITAKDGKVECALVHQLSNGEELVEYFMETIELT